MILTCGHSRTRSTTRSEVLLPESAIPTTVSTATVAASAIATATATAAALPTSVVTTTHASTTATLLSLALALTLPCESICADISKRRFHRIRLGATGTFVAALTAIITPFLALHAAVIVVLRRPGPKSLT